MTFIINTVILFVIYKMRIIIQHTWHIQFLYVNNLQNHAEFLILT